MKLRPHLARLIEYLEPRRLLSIQPVGAEFRVNTYTTNYQSDPSVAMDIRGDFVVTWEGSGASGDGIYAQRFTASGSPLGGEFRVSTNTSAAQRTPVIAMDADGDFVVAWESYGQDGSRDGIYARRYSSAGLAQGDEFRVNTYTTSSQRDPSIAMDVFGDFVVTWYSYQDGFGPGVYAQRFDGGGTALGSEFRVNTFTTNSQRFAEIAMTTEGDFVVTWTSAGGQDGNSDGVFAQRYDSSGLPQGNEFQVNAYTTGRQFAPAIGIDPDGEFVVAWISYQDGNGSSVEAQRFDACGAREGAEFHVNSYTTNRQEPVAVAFDAAGNFVITWDSNAQDGSLLGVYSKRFPTTGAEPGDEFQVNSFTPGDQAGGAIGIDPNGDCVVVWGSRLQDGSADGVYAQRYEVVPGVDAATFPCDFSPHRLNVAFSENVSASLGIADLLLLNLTTGQMTPSTDFSLTYDSITNTATFTYFGPGGALPEGNYRATLIASGITTPNGHPLPADYVFNFFFLRGDANHDAIVNLADFNILAANFGQSPRTFSQGDFNYDGLVNLADFNILASRFGTGLSPANFGGGLIGSARKTDHSDLLDLVS